MASIRKHREKWQAQIRIKGWKPIAKSFRRKSDAVAWATTVESEMRRETFVDPRQASATTFAEAIDRYLAEYDNPDSTRVSRCKRLSQHLGDFSLSNLSSKQLAEYRNKRLKLAAPMTVIHELNQLHRILVIATTEWGITLPNGIPKVQLPKRPQGRTRRLSLEEQTRLLSVLNARPLYRDIVLLAIETGMRRGEILSIETQHLNFQKRTLWIPQTKTGFPREIPLSHLASIVINERATANGKIFKITASQLSRAFSKARQEANLIDFRFHDLRHEATSRFFEIGLNMIEVASITGHKSLAMLNRYTHLKAEVLAEKLGGANSDLL